MDSHRTIFKVVHDIPRLLLHSIWNDEKSLIWFKAWLDFCNVLTLLLLAFGALFIAFRCIRGAPKCYVERAAAILTPILVWTSAYLSPKVGDHINQLQQPENRPVSQVTASLHVLKKGQEPFPYLPQNKDSAGNIARLLLGELARWQPEKRKGPWVLWLAAKDSQCWSSTTEANYYAEFTVEPVFDLVKEPAGEFLKHVDLFSIFPNFLPLNTHIDGGTLTVRVNSSLTKSLPILPQDFADFQDIIDEWSLTHPSPIIELHASPAPTPSP